MPARKIDLAKPIHAMRQAWAAAILYSCFTVHVWAAPSGGVLSELEERNRISIAAQRAFFKDDFTQLEQTSSQYRTEQSRTASGLWKLTLFYAGIDQALGINTTKDPAVPFKALEQRVRRWQKQYPSSPSAHIALSLLHINLAWAHRGNGYAITVRPEDWKPFHEHIELARRNLEDYKAIAAIDPRWYEAMLLIATAQGWERDRFDRLFDEAVQREALFYQTYFAALRYLLPKWNGSVPEIEAFVQQAVARTSQQEGEGMYARIYWFASQAEFRLELFDETQVVWPRMKQGFDDVIGKYPDAWNLNNYAKFACLAKDKPKTRELMDRIQYDIVNQAWAPDSLWQECWDWSR